MTIYRVFGFLLFCLTLSPFALHAETQQDHDACMNDATTICGQFIPDRVGVAHCLMANRNRISPECRVALKHFK